MEEIYYLQDGRPVKVLQRYEDQPQWLIQLIPGSEKKWVLKDDLRKYPLPISLPAELSQIQAGIRDFLRDIGTDPLTAQHDAAQLFEKFERLIRSLEDYSTPDFGDIAGFPSDNPNLQAALDLKADLTALGYYIPNSQRGVAGGVASLGSDGKVPLRELPVNLTGGLPALDTFLEADVVAISNVGLSGLQTVDGVSLVVDDIVLAVGQTNNSLNGLWQVKSGAWIRPLEFDANAEVFQGLATSILNGSNKGSIYVLTTENPTLGGTLEFARQPGVSGPTATNHNAFAKWNGNSGKILMNSRTTEAVTGQIGLNPNAPMAPIVLNANAQNQLVVGLNADRLDNQEGTFYQARANHTGTQGWSTITGTPTTVAGYGITDAAATSHVHAIFTTTVNGFVPAPTTSTGRYLRDDGSWVTVAGGGSGTVTSVALSLPNIFTVSGSPVTTTGTLGATLVSQTTNLVFASPNGSTGTPAFRSLVEADIPALSISKLTSGTLGIARGGTGLGTIPSGKILYTSGLDTLTTSDITAFGRSLIDDADATTGRTTLGLGTAATANAGDFAASGHAHAIFTATVNGFVPAPTTATGKFLKDDATWGTTGSVTSVGLSLPNIFTVTGSPITSSGTLTGTLATQSANLVWAGPNTGVAAAPTFRSLVAADIPSLDTAKITTGTFAIGFLPVAASGTSSATQIVRADDSRLSNSRTPTAHASSHATGGSDPLTGSLDANARIAVLKNGVAVGTRRKVNFIEGSNVALTVSEDSAAEEVDITINSTASGGGSGTVTSVGLALPNIFTVTGSPVTISGTLTGTLATQAANLVWAGPSTGSAVAPTFRSLVAADIPNLDAVKITSGNLTLNPTGTTSGQTGALLLRELAANGTNAAIIKAPDALASDRIITLPDASGTLALTEDAIPSSRSITATGNGLTGGGDLSADRTFSLSSQMQNFAGLTIGSNSLPIGNGAGTFSTITVGLSNIRTFLAAPNQGSARNAILAAVRGANNDITSLSGLTTPLSETQGGTGTGTYAVGDILAASATDTLSKVAGNISTTRQFLTGTGTGTAAALPSWAALTANDIPSLTTAKISDFTVASKAVVDTVLIRSATMPSSPVIGQAWDELAANGNLVMQWFWNGTYWLSTQIMETMQYLAVELSASPSYAYYSPKKESNPAYNLFFLKFSATTFVRTTNDSNSYWSLSLQRRTVTGTATTIASLTTASRSPNILPNNWGTSITTMNLHVDLAATATEVFSIVLFKDGTTATPGAILGEIGALYRWARP